MALEHHGADGRTDGRRHDSPTEAQLPQLGEWDRPVHGELGALAVESDGSRVQCHACGQWFKAVAHHARQAHLLTPDEYRAIFQLVCKAKKIPYSDDGLRYLIQEHYLKVRRDLRACHPRDLCDQILDEAKYRNVAPSMTKDLIDRACEAYFVKLA